MKRIGILNGPNLGRLGKREPEVYGGETLKDLETVLNEEAESLSVAVACFQSNHEGALIDQIERWTDEGFSGIIVNPGGLTHTSVALRDALSGAGLPVVEVHISNVHRRETFRHHSYVSPVAVGVIAGLGFEGYLAALRHLAKL